MFYHYYLKYNLIGILNIFLFVYILNNIKHHYMMNRKNNYC